jgi:hypothetical protein
LIHKWIMNINDIKYLMKDEERSLNINGFTRNNIIAYNVIQ